MGRGWPILIALAALSCGLPARARVPQYTYRIVHTFPHDRGAYTEGLFYLDGALYESTGMEGRSFIRKEQLETGQVLLERKISSEYFGEGIVAWKNRVVELTWKSHVGFIYDLATFWPITLFHYEGEGWALTTDGERIIMSDGTPQLRFLNPETFAETGRLTVTEDGVPVRNLNELEWVKGEIFANIWLTNQIVRIDPATGHVVGRIDLTGLLPPSETIPGQTDVLNGIAYDAEGDRLFVTGKNWPKLFQIELTPK